MTLPELYKNITLTSYDAVRQTGNVSEVMENASSFCMGLNTLVTRSVSQLVRSLALQERWKEYFSHESINVRRVPDYDMMLNIAVRAAIDRCTNMETFRSGRGYV